MKTFKSSALLLLAALLPACGEHLVKFQDPVVTPGAPTVISTIPASLATGVLVGTNVSATFSTAMNGATLTTTTFTLAQGVTSIPGAVTYAGTTATFNPTADLTPGFVYTATITTGARNSAGVALASNYVWTFTTAALVPTVLSTVPINVATGVLVGANITATFSTPMNAATIDGTTFTLKQGLTSIPGAVIYAGTTATFNPTADLTPGLLYTATITTGARSSGGIALAANYVWTFTTASAAPTVISTIPANLATGVLVTTNVSALFSTTMNGTTLTTTTFTLAQGPTPIAGAVTYAGTTATFNPTVDLTPGLVYTATITTGAQSAGGTALASDHVWTFTAAAAAPTVLSVTPLNLATAVPVATNVTATFSTPMNGTTLTTTTFLLAQGLTPIAGVVTYVGSTATFNPTADLSPGLLYTATITTGAQSAGGSPLASNYVWTFTTGAPSIPVNMGLAASYGIAATAGITNTITVPISHINGDVILDPNQTCNAVAVDNAGGFGLCDGMAPTINGQVITNTFPDTTTAAAVKADLNAAFLSITPLAGPPAVGSLGGAIDLPAGTTLGNVTGSAEVQGDNLFAPGVYQSLTSIIITDDIMLDGGGDTNASWVFQTSSSLTTADGVASPGAHARVLLRNGAKASNVWWQVATSATLGVATEFNGNILAAMDITMKTGATSCGRSMAGAWVGGAGAFVLDSNVVSVPGHPNAPPGCN